MNGENNELNDIILNRNDKHDARKKMLIGIGTLAIVAIVIVIIMGRMSSSAPSQLPHPALPSETAKPVETAAQPAVMPVLPPESDTQQQLEDIAQKVREQSAQQPVPLEQSDVVIIDDNGPELPAHAPAVQPQSVSPAPVASAPAPSSVKQPAGGDVYIQVGSFSRYQPNKAFLDAIERSGYAYTLHRVVSGGQISNKVLVGPFKDRSDARAHLSDVRRKIESGAFIYTIKP